MSNGAEWYCSVSGQRVGPLTLEDLQHRVRAGQVGPADLVWAEGTAQWIAAGQVPALFASLTSPVRAVAGSPVPIAAAPLSVQPSQVGYYAGNAQMPPRAAATLRGHASPRGESGDWPLDDLRIEQFDRALQIRRKISGAAGLYRGLFALTLIGAVVLLLVGGFAVGTSPRGGGLAMGAAMGIGGLCVGIAVLYFFAWRATMRSQRWAPLTLLILFCVGIILNAISVVTATNGAVIPGAVISILLACAFAWVSLKAFLAIPNYLVQPAWCQELIAKAKL